MARRSTMYDEEHRRPPPTLAQLPEHDVKGVFCWCNHCHHNAVIPLAPLIAQLGPDLPFPYVHGRLRCQACGSKDIHARPEWPSLGQVTKHQPLPKREAEPSLNDGGDEIRPMVPDAATAFETG